MPTAVTLNVGQQNSGDGSQLVARGGREGQLISANLHGDYYEQCSRGNVFIGSTAAAGVVPPIYNNTAQTFMIWNPAGSPKNVSIIKVKAGLVTVGVVTDNLCWGYLQNAGSQVATAAPVSALTAVAPANANLMSPNASVTRFAPATATVLAPSFLATIGVSNFMATTPAAANMMWNLTEYYSGDFIVSPNSAVFIANNIAGVATWNFTVVWEEVPI